MSSLPRVSIVMATYNRAPLIVHAIQSVREQTFDDWELIVTDDGSTDETPRVVQEWIAKDGRIRYLRSEVNTGISKNYNRAFRQAQGVYIAMIDDDDQWSDAEKLEIQIKFLDSHPDYVGCGGGVIVVDDRGRECYRYLKPETDEAIRARMLFSNPMANSTTLFRRALGEKVGWYDETIRYSGDRDFWLKIGLEGKLYNFPRYFSYYTMSEISTSIAKIRPHLKASFIVMQRYKAKYPGYVFAYPVNAAQYAYSFLPGWMRRRIHTSLARLKRAIAG